MKLPIPTNQYEAELLSKKYFRHPKLTYAVRYDILKEWIILPSYQKLANIFKRDYHDWYECDNKGVKLVSDKKFSVTPNKLNLFVREDKGYLMADLCSAPADEFGENELVLTEEDAKLYATAVATEAIEAYIAKTTNQGVQMNQEINNAAKAVVSETELSAKLVSGEILLDNIETIADRLVLTRLNWFQKLTISKKQKELAITLATYALVHAIKTGGFGLTKYRINHAALDYVTLAANQRMVKYVVSSLGVDTNVASMLFKAPTISVEG